jgi:ElaB/YqjD/DUF883 family membrane-anchored ribosome-binding protein
MAQAPTRSTPFDNGKQSKLSATEDLQGLKDEAGKKLSDVTDKAKDVAAQAGERVGSMFEEQKKAGAEYIGKLATAAESAAGQLDREAPEAAAYLRRAVEQVKGYSNTLTSRSPRELIDDVQDLARNNPAAFLGATAILGFAVSRFLKTSAPQNLRGSGSIRPAARGPHSGTPGQAQSLRKY